ncbi:MAG: glutamine synthetase III [Bacteroidales bacterium]|nr:glutamine synthetase III [Bacteroidales bacterium]
MSVNRLDLVRSSFEKKALDSEPFAGKYSEVFGELVFDRAKMRQYLDPDVFNRLLDCIEGGGQLDRQTADQVAKGMKEWALGHGVTHVTHWFQPLTDGTAEKHETLIDYDGRGGIIERFDGSSLVQQEPDASSFPNGGIRATFEARGYTAWDPTSPVFIQADTLCIPTIFVSYTGEALDYKTPFKRSIKAVCEAALPICRLFDSKVSKVYCYLGWEQEYFLVDEALYASRTDLMITGRTLLGHMSSKNQQLDDHYFGAIPSRVAAFMRDLELAAMRLGIPLKTRHNEVAPNQFELAPVYGEANLANDQNQILMNLMETIARKHSFVVLLHEKPFEGINGSGKHNNWSLGTDTGTGLFSPGKDAKGNLQFIIFLVNALAAVQKHNALLKASIASAGNEHRLGGNEAPPAIVSAFLGRTMTQVLRKLLELPSGTPVEIAGKKGQKVGLVEIPEIFLDNTDRNRTSPFAFTGNRFEFRAVGSSANCAGPLTVLNTAMAGQLSEYKSALDAELAKGKDFEVAVMDALKPIIASVIDVVCFDGNGYSEEWVREAARRGLDTGTCVPELIAAYASASSQELFERTGVFSSREIAARNEVKWDTYSKKIQIESLVLTRMAVNHIIPAALEYKSRLLQGLKYQMDVFGSLDCCETERGIVSEIASMVEEVRVKVDAMQAARERAIVEPDAYRRAMAYSEIAAALQEIRKPIDRLEELVDNRIWPLPKYRELLFIS